MVAQEATASANAPTSRTSPTLLDRLRTASPPPLFLLAFLGLAMLRYAPAWSSPTTTTVGGGDGDAAIIIWFLR